MTDKATEKNDKATAKNSEDNAPTEVKERETSAEYAENWPDNAPDSVKEYEELRKNPPANQKDLTPKPE